MAVNAAYVEKAENLNARISASPTGADARFLIQEAVRTLALMAKTSNYNYVNDANGTGELAKLIANLNGQHDDMVSKISELETYQSHVSYYLQDIIAIMNQMPINHGSLKMAISDQNDNILVTDTGAKLELEFTCYYSTV